MDRELYVTDFRYVLNKYISKKKGYEIKDLKFKLSKMITNWTLIIIYEKLDTDVINQNSLKSLSFDYFRKAFLKIDDVSIFYDIGPDNRVNVSLYITNFDQTKII